MAARQCKETGDALYFHETKRFSVYEAARLAGIAPSTLYRALNSKKKKKLKKVLAKSVA